MNLAAGRERDLCDGSIKRKIAQLIRDQIDDEQGSSGGQIRASAQSGTPA